MMKKKLVILNTTILLGLGSTIAIPPVFAETNSSQLQQIEQNISQTQMKLTQVEKQIKRVEQAIKDNSEMIRKTENDIKATKEEVKKLEEDIKLLNETIEKRTEILKQRAVSLQESGGTASYLDVIFGSTSISDFIDRVMAVTQITNADRDILQEQEKDKKELVKKQDQVNKKLSELKNKQTELEGMKAQILEQKKQNEELKKQLKKQQQENYAKKSALQQPKYTVTSSSGTNSDTGIKFSAPTNSGSLSDVISAGYRYIGNSVYVFGGGRTQYDIENGRFDCSGFVHWAFAQAGISVGASTDSLKSAGTRVPPNSMKPGDIVFFDTYKKDGHVGIYVGGGKFIGSQTSTGVAVADMTSGYWGSRFNGRVVRVK